MPRNNLRLRISEGNTKTGKIPAVSLPPVKSCRKGIPCFGKCYALKAYRMYPAVRNAWDINYRIFHEGRYGLAERHLRAYLDRKKPSFFRIHVSGDFLSPDHFVWWRCITDKYPDTKFLAFTKRHDIRFSGMADNFAVVLSMWPKMDVPLTRLPKAWMQDGTEDRIPDDALECFGLCDQCGMC